MEEIDSIIIEALKNINCDIDEDVIHLKQFTPSMICKCVVMCLKTIDPEINFTPIIPQSMSLRLKQASDIANYIKNIGYRGDIGYQTILYAQELEIRRVLMYLIERFPREANTSSFKEDTGLISNLVKDIQQQLQQLLTQNWVPAAFFKMGVQKENLLLKHTSAFSSPLKSGFIKSAIHSRNVSDGTFKLNAPKYTGWSILSGLLEAYGERKEDALVSNSILDNNTVFKNQHLQPIGKLADNKLLSTYLEDNNIEVYTANQQQYRQLSMKLSEVTEEKNTLEASLKNTLNAIKLKKRTLAVVSKEGNLEKLKTIIENGKERLIELSHHWDQIHLPLLHEYSNINSESKKQEDIILNEHRKGVYIKEKKKQLVQELQEKHVYEQQLTESCKNVNNNTKRSNYTRRILEIVTNIRKQNNGIQQVLNDTKDLQKDINNLNGQLDRSFTLCDESIFRDAKTSEVARKAYKLLVTLHSRCEDVVKAVVDLGVTERECRTLEEQIESDSLKEVLANLEKVQRDLIDVRKEIVSLHKNV